MVSKNIQIGIVIVAVIMAVGYVSCDEEECGNGTCSDDETVMGCPDDCWDITKTTTCRAAYNETRMSCVDYTVDPDATEKSPMEIYQHIHDSCIALGRTENCQFTDDTGEPIVEECIIKVSQQYSCLEMACVDVENYHICMIPPVNTDSGQVMSLDYGVTTIPVFPYDGWTQAACDTMTGLGINPPESNEIIKDDDLTCDLY